MVRSFILGVAASIMVMTGLSAQDPSTQEDRIRLLEEQNRRILERLQESERRNSTLENHLKKLETEQLQLSEARDASALETQINAMTERLQEPISFKQLVRSGFAIKFYGFLRFDAYYNTARMNSIILPAFVFPENGAAAHRNDDHFALDTRLTRFGFELDAGHIGSAHVTGRLETDFANFPTGSPESRPTPRIRVAYTNINFGDITVRLGQDWDVISPIFPQVNGELLMWNAGNLGDRRPQAQLIWNGGTVEGTQFELRLAAGLTGAVDPLDLDRAPGVVSPFTSTEIDGFDSGHPHGQARIGVTFPSWVEGKRATIGAWGYIAGLETDTKFNGENHFTAWTVGLDWTLPLFGPLSLRGEFFYGQALSDVRGGIAQSINIADGDEVHTIGGWAELVWQVTEDFKLFAGGTMDNPDNSDLSAGSRELNWAVYLASQYNWGGSLKSGLDFIYWETQWLDTGVGNLVRVNFYTQLDF